MNAQETYQKRISTARRLLKAGKFTQEQYKTFVNEAKKEWRRHENHMLEVR